MELIKMKGTCIRYGISKKDTFSDYVIQFLRFFSVAVLALSFLSLWAYSNYHLLLYILTAVGQLKRTIVVGSNFFIHAIVLLWVFRRTYKALLDVQELIALWTETECINICYGQLTSVFGDYMVALFIYYVLLGCKLMDTICKWVSIWGLPFIYRLYPNHSRNYLEDGGL